MERACEVVELRESQIEAMCREHFGSEGHLQFSSPLSLGAVNTSYKILWNDTLYVLRVYVRDPELAKVEDEVYQLVRKKVAVPNMLYVGSFKELYPFAIFEFVDKKHIFEISDDSLAGTLSFELGKVLATIHSFRFPEAGLFGKGFTILTPFEEGSSPYFDYIMQHFSDSSLAWKRLGDERASDLKSFLVSHREYFPTIHNGGVLVHSDFKPVNLLWSEQDGLTVLDWEFAHIGHPLLDLGILLRHYQEFPFSLKSFESGYFENGRTLPHDWIRKARITDTINIVQLLNTPTERPRLFRSLLQSIDLTTSKWLSLKDFIRQDIDGN